MTLDESRDRATPRRGHWFRRGLVTVALALALDKAFGTLDLTGAVVVLIAFCVVIGALSVRSLHHEAPLRGYAAAGSVIAATVVAALAVIGPNAWEGHAFVVAAVLLLVPVVVAEDDEERLGHIVPLAGAVGIAVGLVAILKGAELLTLAVDPIGRQVSAAYIGWEHWFTLQSVAILCGGVTFLIGGIGALLRSRSLVGIAFLLGGAATVGVIVVIASIARFDLLLAAGAMVFVANGVAILRGGKAWIVSATGGMVLLNIAFGVTAARDGDVLILVICGGVTAAGIAAVTLWFTAGPHTAAVLFAIVSGGIGALATGWTVWSLANDGSLLFDGYDLVTGIMFIAVAVWMLHHAGLWRRIAAWARSLTVPRGDVIGTEVVLARAEPGRIALEGDANSTGRDG